MVFGCSLRPWMKIAKPEADIGLATRDIARSKTQTARVTTRAARLISLRRSGLKTTKKVNQCQQAHKPEHCFCSDAPTGLLDCFFHIGSRRCLKKPPAFLGAVWWSRLLEEGKYLRNCKNGGFRADFPQLIQSLLIFSSISNAWNVNYFRIFLCRSWQKTTFRPGIARTTFVKRLTCDTGSV